jgi:hypothetical protein
MTFLKISTPIEGDPVLKMNVHCVALVCSVFFIGCGKDFSQLPFGKGDQPATQNPAAQTSTPLPVQSTPRTPQADPLASSKTLAKHLDGKSVVATMFSKRVYEVGDESFRNGLVVEGQKRDFWEGRAYNVEDVAFDVKKTDSLVSPYLAEFTLTTLQSRVEGGDVSYADAVVVTPDTHPDYLKMTHRFSTEQKVKSSSERGKVERKAVAVTYAWQDNKWVFKTVRGMYSHRSRHVTQLLPAEWPK